MKETSEDVQGHIISSCLSSGFNNHSVGSGNDQAASDSTADYPTMALTSPKFAFPWSSPSCKAELSTLHSPYQPEATEPHKQRYPLESDIRQLQLRISKDRLCNSRRGLLSFDRLSSRLNKDLLIDLLGHFEYNTPQSIEWTQSELNGSGGPEFDRLLAHSLPSLTSLPSLASSGTSSIPSNSDESCATPEMSIGSRRLPLSRSTVMRYKPSSAPRSDRSDITTIGSNDDISHTTSGRTFDNESKQLPQIEHAPVSNVDWDHWYPTKYQCVFCERRFLLETGLKNHMLTHKRHRRYMKLERKHKCLISSNESSVDISTHTLQQKALVYRPLQPAKEAGIPVSLNETSLSDDNVACRTMGRTISSTVEISPLSRHYSSNDGDTNDRSYANEQANSRGIAPLESRDETISMNCFQSPVQAHNTSVLASRLSFRMPSMQPGVTNYGSKPAPKRAREFQDMARDREGIDGCDGLNDFEDLPIFDLELDGDHQHDNKERDIMITSLVASMKQKLIIRIMGEFMAISNQNWVSNTQNRGSSSRSKPSGTDRPESKTHSQASMGRRGRQLHREDNHNEGPGDSDGDGDGDDQRTPKKPRTMSTALRDPKESCKFACPYRKYDPRKYCVQNWRPCALTALDSVARVKAHLYRHHRIFQCQRCKATFLNQTVLNEHILAILGCEPNLVNLAEGITSDIEKRLRSRKKTHPDQTEVDRWNEIYNTLFPRSALPSPFFEPVEESVEQTSDSAKLADFETYTQKELPKMFWAALEEVVASEMQPVEERLRAQLMGVIRDCQDRVFSTYHSMVTSTIDPLLRDKLTRDSLLQQFEPLSRATTSQSQTSTSFLFPALYDMSTVKEANTSGRGELTAFNSSSTLNSIFNSTTTLSSNFNSSTTLSSIASSQIPPGVQPGGTKLSGKSDEIASFTLTAKDDSLTSSDILLENSWTTELNAADLTQFDSDFVWDTEAITYEDAQ